MLLCNAAMLAAVLVLGVAGVVVFFVISILLVGLLVYTHM